MAVTREQIVNEAREWIGTPWIHGVSDCAQLIMRVGKGCNAFRPNAVEDKYMNQFVGYGIDPIPKNMLKALNFLMVKVDEPKLGDVCFFFHQGAAQHLGIISRRPGACMYVIHGFNKSNIMKVVESRIVNPGHILGVWQYPMVVID